MKPVFRKLARFQHLAVLGTWLASFTLAIPFASGQGGGVGSSAAVAPKQQPLPFSGITDIHGFVGRRMEANRKGYLQSFDIDREVRRVEEAKTRDWFWIGEQPGKWLESAAWSCHTTTDPAFEAKTRAVLARLEAAQKPDGYLGITDPAIRTAQQPVRGMDPYELYFMLHGLITASQELGDAKALASARKLADYLVDRIGPGKAEFWPGPSRPPENQRVIQTAQHAWVPPGTPFASTLVDRSQIAGHTAHYGFEGTLLIDPITRLYQLTGDAKYLRWSQWVVANMDKWSGWDAFTRLDEIADGKISAYQLQPYVHSHTFHMNFLGLLRLYQATGEASLLRKVRGTWADIARHQMYITGGVSVAEHYEVGNFKPVEGDVVETCANMSWMDLTQCLLELTDDPVYADAIESLLVNHVFASQTQDGDSYRYHTPPNGQKPVAYFHGPDCCTSSGHRLVSMLPRFFYGQSGNTLYINQFVPSKVRFAVPGARQVTLAQNTDFPESGRIAFSLALDLPASFAIKIRIPAWCATATLNVNGQPVGVTPGSYAVLTREWKNGDKIDLDLPMALAWVQSDGGETKPPTPVDQRLWALRRGPVVYAADTVWWKAAEIKRPARVGRELAVTPVAAPSYERVSAPAGAVGPFFLVPVELASGEKQAMPMAPFANVGTWYRHDEPRPPRNAAAHSYAVWLPKPDNLAFRATAVEERAILNAIDFVRIGDPASERAHGLAGQSDAALFNGKAYRHSERDFSYSLMVLPDAKTDLVCTFWGSDVGRRFDIFADGELIGSQTLQNNKPGEFFSVRFAIPSHLVQGKTNALGQKVDRVTIKFVAKRGVAGGIFGVRTEPSLEP